MQRDSDVVVKQSLGASVTSVLIVAIVVAAVLALLLYRHSWPTTSVTDSRTVAQPANDNANSAASGSGGQQSGGRTTTNTHPH
jgi:lipopolysaccharide export LptBFGC system permease protein LptF